MWRVIWSLVVETSTLVDRGRVLDLAFFARDPHLENREMWGTRGQGPSTSQNRSLRERFCSARDGRVILRSGVSALAQNAKEWAPVGEPHSCQSARDPSRPWRPLRMTSSSLFEAGPCFFLSFFHGYGWVTLFMDVALHLQREVLTGRSVIRRTICGGGRWRASRISGRACLISFYFQTSKLERVNPPIFEIYISV